MAALEEFYDEETWAAIDGWGRRTATAGSHRPSSTAQPDGVVPPTFPNHQPTSGAGHVAAPGGRVRMRAAGAVVAGALFTGVADALEEPNAEPDEEFRPELDDTRLARVTYFHTPGYPEESVAIVRPWLF